MSATARRVILWTTAAILGSGAVVLIQQAPSIAAGGLLYPGRIQSRIPAPERCVDRSFEGDGVTLQGWYCSAATKPRATVVYLHGIADNRSSAVGAVNRFTKKGMDVVAYDSRRHGASGGDVCTYGFYEKRDLHRVIDSLPSRPVVLIGTSLGAAVALQAAAGDDRVRAVVAAETFSDIKTIARERAPFFLPEPIIIRAFALAGERGRFDLDAASPVIAARSIRSPVLLIHGENDTETSPDHSRRVFAALAGPTRLMLLPGVGHNHSLGSESVWKEIENWIEPAVGGHVGRDY